ncbi:MarR family transcriptional regulator [Xylophilus rhododendri]|uniref:MarR family transcriptional regulator n=1 Tax=Xylophilus rhododendri TaxID=2697032 RepID=A0A857JA32_9BURK|nr:MarR family transcriptional regulator [Xylophilus rhododendri]QHJ00871.1 MarR family transcriptional regulator [Xylophilus rhododendri]
MPPSADDDRHALAAELRLLLSSLRKRLREESTIGDFSWSQLQVILRLERDGPATVSALAKAEGMRPQSMSETVAGLKAAGVLAGSVDPQDGRQTLIALTPAWLKAVQDNRAARADWLYRAIGQKMDEAEQACLQQAVALLKRLLEP